MNAKFILALAILSITYPLLANKNSHAAHTPNKHIDIKKVMNYPMDEQVKRHMKDHKVDYKTAKMHEREFKRWLLIDQDTVESLDMFSAEVDEFWHTLLLYTKEYQKFCHECFGHFIHHVPKKIEDINLN